MYRLVWSNDSHTWVFCICGARPQKRAACLCACYKSTRQLHDDVDISRSTLKQCSALCCAGLKFFARADDIGISVEGWNGSVDVVRMRLSGGKLISRAFDAMRPAFCTSPFPRSLPSSPTSRHLSATPFQPHLCLFIEIEPHIS